MGMELSQTNSKARCEKLLFWQNLFFVFAFKKVITREKVDFSASIWSTKILENALRLRLFNLKDAKKSGCSTSNLEKIF